MSLCAYKDIFGAPNTGVHKFKVLDTAVVDWVLTFLLAIGVSYYSKVPFTPVLIGLLVLGVVLHILFCVSTPTTKFLGFK
jgi:hypothetical protein